MEHKTELEKLKDNTRKAYAEQRTNELIEMLSDITEKWLESKIWEIRAARLTLFTLFSHFIIVVLCVLLNTPPEVADITNLLTLLVFFTALIREHTLARLAEYNEGVVDGALKTLEQLDLLQKNDGNKIRRQVKERSPYSRFKELWERLGEQQKKYA